LKETMVWSSLTRRLQYGSYVSLCLYIVPKYACMYVVCWSSVQVYILYSTLYQMWGIQHSNSSFRCSP
jgi:hypothetical protein